MSRLPPVAASFLGTVRKPADALAFARGWVPHDFLPVADGTEAPMVRIRITGPNGVPYEDYGILDTGSDGSAFPIDFMPVLGIDEDTCVEHEIDTAGGKARQFSHLEPLSVWSMRRTVHVPANFCDTPYPILGRDDFMNGWQMRFDCSARRVWIRRD